MHILTKVFVLFAAVLSIMLSALTISYTINTDQIVSNYNDAQEAAETARTSLAAQSARHGSVVQNKDTEIASLRAQIAATTNTMHEIERNAAQLESDVRTAQADAAAANRRVQGALEATKAQALIIEAYKNEVSILRDNELATRGQLLELEERLSDVTSISEVHVATIRALREQLEGQKTGSTAVAAGEIDPTTARELPGAIIRGSVQSVAFDSDSGRYICQINLGENDRMSRGVKVNIVRDNMFIGELIITRTDLNVATGFVYNMTPNTIVRQGDEIKSRLMP